MSTLINIDESYAALVARLCERFKAAQIKASVKVNNEMLRFYYYLGSEIVVLKAEQVWGSKFMKCLSQDLKRNMPGVTGLSETNLGYAKRFYLLYSPVLGIHPQLEGEKQADSLAVPIHPQLGGELFELPWGHHKFILDKCGGDVQKAVFFIHKSLQDGWSRAVLLNMMGTDLYLRQGKAVSNFNHALPKPDSDLAQEMTKDPYKFDFISLTEPYREKELKDALMDNLVRFLLELGTGFAFVGREYRLMIGNTEKFIDMLFYHLRLRCYVVVEVKTTRFDSDHIGQLGTYVTAVNHLLKTPADNPTLGLLICKEKDNVLAKYAVESSHEPIGISEYELQKVIGKEYESTLPTIEEIENELKETHK